MVSKIYKSPSKPSWENTVKIQIQFGAKSFEIHVRFLNIFAMHFLDVLCAHQPYWEFRVTKPSLPGLRKGKLLICVDTQNELNEKKH